jgi:NAD+-dependent farnesol dehydrogenase
VREFAHKGLFSVIVNPTRVYGPGQLSYSNAFCRMLLDGLKGKFVFVPGGRCVLSNYAFIDDVVDGHIKAMQRGIGGERYILGGENITYEEVLHVLKNEVKKIHLIPLSLTAMKFLGYIELIMNKISDREPLITPDAAKRFFFNSTFSSQKAISQLYYSITPFTEGLKQTIDYVNTIYHDK